MPPVQMGGHAATSQLVPALLPPHRKITNRRLAAVTALFFGCDTRRVSQCARRLLQGFNMHSHEAMNNMFEILNQEFQHQHKLSFTEDDFRKLFGVDSVLGAGFFGEYSAFVSKIVFDGKTKDKTLLSILKTDLAKQNLLLVEGGKPEDAVAGCPGLSVTHNDHDWFRIELHREMFSVSRAGKRC